MNILLIPDYIRLTDMLDVIESFKLAAIMFMISMPLYNVFLKTKMQAPLGDITITSVP